MGGGAPEALAERRFGPSRPNDALRRLAREAPTRLPPGAASPHGARGAGPWADLRDHLRESVRNDGEVDAARAAETPPAPRKIWRWIDVSGSMKARSEDHLQLRACAGTGTRIESSSPLARVLTR